MLTTAEQKLINILQETFGAHLINDKNSITILNDITSLLIARKSFGINGEHPLSKLLRSLNKVDEMNQKYKETTK